MNGPEFQPFKLRACLVEPEINRISRNSECVPIPPKVMGLLVYLARRNTHVVSDMILEDLWGNVCVASASVYFHVSQLREALGDDSHHPTYIDTVAKCGYRLIAPVEFEDGMDNGSSVAVMAFVDLDPTGDQEYFADGISEELLNSLTRIKGLRVAARTSSFSLKKKDLGATEIGEALGVDYIVEGSVRREAARVRVTVQLIKTSDGFDVWSETYDRKRIDIFDIQKEICVAIVDALKIQLTREATNARSFPG